MGDKAAAAAKSEIMKGDKLGRQGGSGSQKRDKAAAAAKSETMNKDKLGRQGGSGSQKRNHEGRQASQTRWQQQPKAKGASLGEKAAAAAKSEIMK